MRFLAMLAIGALLLAGCGESRQQKFERALREAETARVDLETEREELRQSEVRHEDAQQAAARAEAELEAARTDVEAASGKLDAARAEVLKWAPADMLPPEMEATLPNSDAAPPGAAETSTARPTDIDR